MFGWDQRQRLLRENWNAPALAEEIFAMMSPDVPNNTEAPVNVALPTGSIVAPYQIANYTPGDPIMSFTGKNGADLGCLTLGTGGVVNFNSNGSGTGTSTSIGGGSGSGGTTIPVWG